MKAGIEFIKKHCFIICLSFIVIISYGLLLSRLSFYGDDWIYIYNYHLLGSKSFAEFTAWDRPFSSWIYTFTSFLFGEHVLPYHLLILSERWLSAFILWKILVLVWGDRSRLSRTAVLLFAIFPGFQQQPIAVQFILHFASLDLCLLSIWFMLSLCKRELDCRCSRLSFIGGTILSTVISGIAAFSCEYFIGLEIIRPILLLFMLINYLSTTQRLQSLSQKIKYVLSRWLPYLFMIIIFLIWRVFIFSFQTYQPKFFNKLLSEPGSAIPELFLKILHDLKVILFTVWKNALVSITTAPDKAAAILILICVFGLAMICLHHHNTEEKLKQVALQVLFTGIAAILAAGIPFWSTLINVESSFPWDRSTISFSVGVALVFASLSLIVLQPASQWVIISFVIASAGLFHYNNGLVYVHEAQKMNDYFWQLSWRIPALEKGTILVSENIPLNRYSDSDLTPIVNWQYAPDLRGNTYDYKYFDLDLRGETYYSDLSTSMDVSHGYRSHQFFSSTDKTLGIYYHENECLWVLSAEESSYPGLPDSLGRVSQISNPDLIQVSAESTHTPPTPIGAEPEHRFCYYFQKLNLAVQRGDLDKAESIISKVESSKLEPTNSVDWMPFFLYEMQTQNKEAARYYSEKIRSTEEGKVFLCKRLSSKDITSTLLNDAAFMKELGCQ